MDFYKKFFSYILFIIIFFILFSFISVSCFASELEDVDVDVVNNLVFYPNANYISSSTTGSVAYFPIEVGYIYHFQYVGSSTSYNSLALSKQEPANLVPITYLTRLDSDNPTYDYLSTSNDYLYFNYSWADNNVKITREKITNMSGVVDLLSGQVSPTAIWKTFETSIPYILIVVVASFGLFWIFHLIKEISEGKEKM